MTFMILLIESENITNISSQELRFLYYIALSYKQPNLIIINHQHLLCKQMIYLHSRVRWCIFCKHHSVEMVLLALP